jgi:hypothetical protein
MKGQVALGREQGVEFAVVVVKPQVVRGSESQKDEAVRAWTIEFGVPTVLMAQDSRGVPEYYGRPDLVGFLANLFPEQLPWREFTIAALGRLTQSAGRTRARVEARCFKTAARKRGQDEFRLCEIGFFCCL